jgi:exodeoxyribonuclease VII large subunit
MSSLPLFDRADKSDEPMLRVSQLNRSVRALLEDKYKSVWVEGELSDVTLAASGHAYFTLNDEDKRNPAQVRGVMFRNDAQRCKAHLKNGARVQMRGQVSLFEPRGSFQLIARIARPVGEGDLQAELARLKEALLAEGLLDPARKRPLPLFPRVIGVVTSATGAAVHDIIRVAHARCAVRIILSPCVVQGAEATQSIVQALEAIQRVPDLDVVIIGRGGGAAEDLQAFNDERVVRAIGLCRVPTVSAVGHEVDVTLADLIADVRAATPSNAAELVVPEQRVLQQQLENAERRLARGLEIRLGQERLRLDRQARKLAAPIRTRLRNDRAELQRLHERVARRDPRVSLARDRAQLIQRTTRIDSLIRPLLANRRARLSELSARLTALSPTQILARGYAIALHETSGKALLHATDAAVGDRVIVRLHQGSLTTRVEKES